MKKLSMFTSLLFLLILVLAACGNGGSSSEEGGSSDPNDGDVADGEMIDLTILTGGEQGTYFPLGAALANNIINPNVNNVIASSFSSGASVANINDIVDGNADLALVQNDIAYYASNGLNMFDGDVPMTGFHGIATLYPEVVQIITSADSGIETEKILWVSG